MIAAAATSLLLAAAPPDATRTGYDRGADLHARDRFAAAYHGYLRLRAQAPRNLDLDRGPSPSGQLTFPVPAADPSGQWLAAADMRWRSDLSLLTPRVPIAVRTRFDVLDNASLGTADAGRFSAGGDNIVSVKQIYADWRTPLGVLSVGRMGVHWGMGMVANGGDCLRCDAGTVADRVQFAAPILRHFAAVAFDVGSNGPQRARVDRQRVVDVEPTDNVRAVTVAALRYRRPRTIARRRRAGRTTLDYGAFYNYRWQRRDLGLPQGAAPPAGLAPSAVVQRRFSAHVADGWARVAHPWVRVEAEAAVVAFTARQASAVPGLRLREPIGGTQFGAALQSDVGTVDGILHGGVDAGYASGDAAPGVGVGSDPNDPAPQPGDIRGPQLAPPYDRSNNEFAFHSDYRVDRILFRELIGAVADAAYLRPHADVRLLRSGESRLSVELAGVVSRTVHPASSPNLRPWLGTEVDATLAYELGDALVAGLDYAVLIPLEGLSNGALGLTARPAQLWQLRAAFTF